MPKLKNEAQLRAAIVRSVTVEGRRKSETMKTLGVSKGFVRHTIRLHEEGRLNPDGTLRDPTATPPAPRPAAGAPPAPPAGTAPPAPPADFRLRERDPPRGKARGAAGKKPTDPTPPDSSEEPPAPKVYRLVF